MRHYRSGLIVAVALVTMAFATATEFAAQPGEARQVARSAPATRASAAVKATALTATAYAPSAAISGGINWGPPIFVDNFNGTTLNLTHWLIYNRPFGRTHSRTRYTPQSVKVAGGYLNLIGHYQAPYGFVGGGIAYRANRTFGRWVIRFRADNGAGYEPVVLLWPRGGTRLDGEIDIAEVFPGSVLPVSTNRRGAGEFLHMVGQNRFIGHRIPTTVNFARWHTIAVNWLPGYISMWLDGQRVWRVPRDLNGSDYIPTGRFHLALQLDEGCTRNRCRPDSSTPKRVIMQVDWVKIYAAPRALT